MYTAKPLLAQIQFILLRSRTPFLRAKVEISYSWYFRGYEQLKSRIFCTLLRNITIAIHIAVYMKQNVYVLPALCAVLTVEKSCITAQARTLKQYKTILSALLQGSKEKTFALPILSAPLSWNRAYSLTWDWRLPVSLTTNNNSARLWVRSRKPKRKRNWRQLTQAERRIEELDRLFKRIYEDNANGKLSDSRFQTLSDDYEQEQEELREKLLWLNEEINEQEEQSENIDRFIGKVRKYLDLEELTPSVFNDMVKAVYIHAPDKAKGHREQQIDISYDLVGILPVSLLNDLQNGETA